MKKSFLLAIVCITLPSLMFSQAVGINNPAPHASSVLDIQSTTRGVLMPRMTTQQRTDIASPAEGLKVFDTDTKTFWFYNGTGWIESATGAATNFWSLSGNDIFKSNTGNVGIGTSTPADLFTVQSASNSFGITHTDGTIKITTFVGGGSGGGWMGTQSNHPFHIYTNNNVTPNVTFTTGFNSEFKGVSPSIRLIDGSANSGTLQSSGNNLIVSARTSSFTTPGNLILQIPLGTSLLAGNVGIGTSVVPDKLTVDAGTGEYGITQTDGTITVGSWVGNGGGYYGTKTNHPLRFFTNNAATQMTILVNGNVGIGTANPTYKLSVKGNIRSEEVVVETGWADYVFDETYSLRPLNEVEKFIRQHKHLPNIPSAKEIEIKGLHLGDVQKRMMEKIEELTLYIIKQQKEIDELKKSVSSNPE